MLPAKYAPQSVDEVRGQNTAMSALTQFVNRPAGKIALLHGPSGIGKTSMVHALAKTLNAELLEVNASDVRNEAGIRTVLGPALMQQSLFFTKKIILFDEIDGLSGNSDRGGLAALLELAKETPHPIIMTANDPWQEKFSTLRKNSVMIQLNTLAYTTIAAVLKDVCEKEKINVHEDVLKTIARRAGGDLRAALIDLEILGKDIDAKAVESLSERNSAESIFNAIRLVLKTKDPIVARQALDAVHEDLDEIFLWMDENLPKEYTKPDDLHRAYDAFSRADVFRGRIRRWQHWRFLVYSYDLIGPGISIAKNEKYNTFTKLAPTQRLFAQWRNRSKNRDAIVDKLALISHTSKRRARQEFAILKPVLAQAQFLNYEEREWIEEHDSRIHKSR